MRVFSCTESGFSSVTWSLHRTSLSGLRIVLWIMPSVPMERSHLRALWAKLQGPRCLWGCWSVLQPCPVRCQVPCAAEGHWRLVPKTLLTTFTCYNILSKAVQRQWFPKLTHMQMREMIFVLKSPSRSRTVVLPYLRFRSPGCGYLLSAVVWKHMILWTYHQNANSNLILHHSPHVRRSIVA